MISRVFYLLGLSALALVTAGELPSASLSPGTEGGNGENSTGAKPEHISPRSSRFAERPKDSKDPPQLQQLAEVDFCVGLHKLLEASTDGFRSVTQAFKETPTGVLVGLGTVQLPGAVLCTAVQHLVSGAWKASYTCHFAGDDETVPKAEADRRFEVLKQQTRGCVPESLKERDSTGGEDLGVVSASFVGDPAGPTVTVFLNYNGGSAEHPSTIDLWLSVMRSLPTGPEVGRPAAPSPEHTDLSEVFPTSAPRLESESRQWRPRAFLAQLRGRIASAATPRSGFG
jgi:hypothetical protein